MKIIDTNWLLYVNGIGFIRKSRIIVSALVLLLCIMFSAEYSHIKHDESMFNSLIENAPLPAEEHITTLEEQVMGYIHTKNPALDEKTVEKLSNSIVTESIAKHIQIELVLGLIATESAFEQFAVSSVGALGFMQVMPGVHRDKIPKLDNKDVYDPVSNIKMGVTILSDCMHRTKTVTNALLCYNGSQTDETQKYAKKVLSVSKSVVLSN